MLCVMHDMCVMCYGIWRAYGGDEVDVRKYIPPSCSDQGEIYEFQRDLMLPRTEKGYDMYSFLPV